MDSHQCLMYFPVLWVLQKQHYRDWGWKWEQNNVAFYYIYVCLGTLITHRTRCKEACAHTPTHVYSREHLLQNNHRQT